MSTLSDPLNEAVCEVASPSDLSIVVVRDLAGLAAIAPQWRELAGDVPFRGWEWADSWWRHYRTRHCQLYTLVVYGPSSEVLAIAPWYVDRTAYGGRVVRFLGSGEVCSDYLTILCRLGHEAAVATRISDWMACEAKSTWHLIDLEGVAAADEVVNQVVDRFAARGHGVHRQAIESAWRVSLPGDWQTYLATLSKSRRNRTRAILRDQVDSGQVVLRTATTAAELARGFEVLVDLHQKRRRSLAEPGCFTSSRFTEFHREVSARLMDAGKLRLSWFELAGRPVTVDYSFVGGDTVYYYQGGFEPDLADDRPGWLSHATSLKRSIDEGFRAYDFLRGDEAYKASWGAKPVPLARVRIAGQQASAKALYATWRGSQAVKCWTRRVISQRQG